MRPYLDFGFFQLGERLLNFASRNLDKLLIGSWLGTEALGAYSLAYQLMIRPFRLLTSVSTNVTRELIFAAAASSFARAIALPEKSMPVALAAR